MTNPVPATTETRMKSVSEHDQDLSWLTALGEQARSVTERLAGKAPALVAVVYMNGHGGYTTTMLAGRKAVIAKLREYADFLESKPTQGGSLPSLTSSLKPGD